MHTKIEQLRELGQKIESWRASRDLSKNALCRKFGQLGSSKTYGRVLDTEDDLGTGFDVEKHLLNYQAAWALAQSWTEDPEENRVYRDLGSIEDAIAEVKEALMQSDITRFVLISGGSGSGKTSILDVMESDPKLGPIMSRVEASEAWRGKASNLLGALIQEIGHSGDRSGEIGKAKMPHSTNEKLEKLIERMNGRRMILAIDEGHHIGAEGYNIIKTIINRTRAVVVMTAVPALLSRLNKTAFEESRQLFDNRCSGHVRLGSPESGDVLEYLTRRGLKFASDADAAKISNVVAKDAASFGFWKYVKRCAGQARKGTVKSFAEADFARVIAKVKNSVSMGE